MTRKVKSLDSRAITITFPADERLYLMQTLKATIAAGMPVAPPNPVIGKDDSGKVIADKYAAWQVLFSRYSSDRANAEHGGTIASRIVNRVDAAMSAAAEVLALAAAERANKEVSALKSAQATAAAAAVVQTPDK